MSIAIDATVGGAASNSFITEVEAIAYAATRLNLTGWVTVSGTSCTENEKKALIEATRELDVYVYKGRRVSSTQRLSWPRAYAVNEEDETIDQLLVDAQLAIYYTGIPQRLKDATAELALEFLRAGTTDIARADTTAGVIREKVDVLETEWEPGSRRATGLARFPRVINLIGPLLAYSGNEVVRA